VLGFDLEVGGGFMLEHAKKWKDQKKHWRLGFEETKETFKLIYNMLSGIQIDQSELSVLPSRPEGSLQ
jgi:hypothetical protein